MQPITSKRDALGECPVWDDRANRLWRIDVVGKAIRSTREDGSDQIDWPIDDFPGSIGLREDGGLIVACRRSIRLLDRDGREVARTALPEEVVARERFNDGACDGFGRFWVGTMDKNMREPIGGLYRIDPDLTITRMSDGITLSNGIAWSPDNSRLYHCDSVQPRVIVHDFDGPTGTLSNCRIFARFSDDMGKADGSVVDSEGHLWVASPGTGTILRFSPAGLIVRRLHVPTAYPSAIAIGGEDRQTAFVTSLQPPHGGQDADGHLYQTGVGVSCLPTARFAG